LFVLGDELSHLCHGKEHVSPVAVMYRLIEAIVAGRLNGTMDLHNLVSLSLNSQYEIRSTLRRFSKEEMKF
jgi:hypothetical protein